MNECLSSLDINIHFFRSINCILEPSKNGKSTNKVAEENKFCYMNRCNSTKVKMVASLICNKFDNKGQREDYKRG